MYLKETTLAELHASRPGTHNFDDYRASSTARDISRHQLHNPIEPCTQPQEHGKLSTAKRFLHHHDSHSIHSYLRLDSTPTFVPILAPTYNPFSNAFHALYLLAQPIQCPRPLPLHDAPMFSMQSAMMILVISHLCSHAPITVIRVIVSVHVEDFSRDFRDGGHGFGDQVRRAAQGVLRRC